MVFGRQFVECFFGAILPLLQFACTATAAEANEKFHVLSSLLMNQLA